MRAAWRLAAIPACGMALAWAVAAAASPAAGAGPLTFEEILRDQRAFTAVRFSPDGRRLVAAIGRNGVPTHGASAALSDTRAIVWDLRTGRRRRVGGPTQAFLPSLCDPWSPQGEVLAGFSLVKGQRRLRTWTVASGRFVTFAPTPMTTCPTWAGERLVYAAGPAGAPGVGDSSLTRVAHLADRWRKAGDGAAAPVTIHSNDPDFPSPLPAPGELIVADPRDGQTHLIANGDFHSVTPSPDGRFVAVVRLGPVDAKALYSVAGRRGGLELYRLTPQGGVRIGGLPGIDVDYAGLTWSPDGRRLLVAGRDPTDDTLELVTVRTDGGAPHRLTLPAGIRLGDTPHGLFSRLRQQGWLGEHPAFVASKSEDLAAPSDGHTVYGEGVGRGFHVFVETDGGIEDLTGFVRQSVTAFAAGPDGGGLVVADGSLWGVRGGREPRQISPPGMAVVALATARPSFGLPPVYAVTADRVSVTIRAAEGTPHLVTLEASSGRTLSDLPSEDVAALAPALGTAVLRTREGWSQRLSLQGQANRPLMTLDAAWRGRPVGDVRPLDYLLAGRRLRAWVLLPPGYSGGRIPALLWIYGGEDLSLAPPRYARPEREPTPIFSGQLWAAQGYAVIYPSTPLGDAAHTDVAKTLTDEALAAVDAASAAGWVDPARVGIIGHSFGAFSVAAVLTQRSDRFRAGIAMSGPYDFSAGWGARAQEDLFTDTDSYAFLGETLGYVENGQIGLGGPPWADQAAYVRASPFFSASAITTPLLLTAGDLDLGSTSLQQSERLYAALLRAGRPAVLVRYWGEGHVQSDPLAVRDQWTRFRLWFARYLMADGGAAPTGLREGPPAPPHTPHAR